MDVGAALSPVLLWELEAEESQLAAAGEELAGELPRVLPFLDMGRNLRGDEPAHGLAELVVLVREGGRHGALAGVPDHVHVAASSRCPPGAADSGARQSSSMV